MTKGKWLLVLATTAATAAVSGCASNQALTAPLLGLRESGLINDPRQVSALEKSMTDGDIARLLDADIRAKLPTSVAIARLVSDCDGYQPRLKTVDAAELEGWEKTVKGQPLIRSVQPVAPMIVGGDERPSLHSLRTAAAKMNCELLLVYFQGDSSVDNFNEAAVLYWTFVGLWLVPGDTFEHRTVMQGVLFDCRTGAILGTATGDSHLKRACPAAFADIQRAKLAQAATSEARADLQKGFSRLVGQVVQSALAKNQITRAE